GLPVPEIEKRIEYAVSQLHIEELLGRSLFQLSGGEKQKIACASVAAACSEIIVLDEPSSNLDIYAIEDLKEILSKWKQQGKTIIIAEHRLHFLRNLADRMIVMDKGEIVKELNQREILKLSVEDTGRMGIRPLRMEELHCTGDRGDSRKHDISLNGISYHYPGTKKGIQIDRIAVGEGAVVAVIGHNGAGKSTFAKCLCGLEKKCRGNLCINEKCYRSKERLRNCYLVMQDVNHQLFTESVLDEVLLSLNEDDREEHQKEEAAKEILRDMDLLEYAQAHPMALSGGQKQRCAIASAMASGRKIILFDEPTSGLDYRHMNQVAANLRKLGEMGKTVFVITHDLELIMKCCTDILHLENGTVEEFYPLNQQNEAHIQAFSGMGRKPETKEE
ncbi:MAG: ATP-binding cassette domain-containing protein, partial [Clostridia bacterium]|nr:ATP-binding cassette domain-containing protein [Clostridia bacterium]